MSSPSNTGKAGIIKAADDAGTVVKLVSISLPFSHYLINLTNYHLSYLQPNPATLLPACLAHGPTASSGLHTQAHARALFSLDEAE